MCACFVQMSLKIKARGKDIMLHTYLPIFGNILCNTCEQRFEVKQKFFEHCETKGHQRKLDAHKALLDIHSERRLLVEAERYTLSQVIIDFIQNITEKDFFTNFDCLDSIIDRLDLFLKSQRESQ